MKTVRAEVGTTRLDVPGSSGTCVPVVWAVFVRSDAQAGWDGEDDKLCAVAGIEFDHRAPDVRAYRGAGYEFGGDLVVRSSRRGPGCDLPFTLGQEMHVGVRSGPTLVGGVLDDSTRNRRRQQRFAGRDDADGVQ
jgi:hypothetical protein